MYLLDLIISRFFFFFFNQEISWKNSCQMKTQEILKLFLWDSSETNHHPFRNISSNICNKYILRIQILCNN